MTKLELIHSATTGEQPAADTRARQRQRPDLDEEIAQVLRERVRADLARHRTRRDRTRRLRQDLDRGRRYAKARLHAEKLAAPARRLCECPQPRPPALLQRDPAGGTAAITSCPRCGGRT